MRIDRGFERNVAISLRGYSFNFASNFKGYVTWAERTKKRIRRKALALCREWAQEIVQEAQKRCPEFSDSSVNMSNLTNSIKVEGAEGLYNKTDYGKSKMSITVGVDADNWQSDYDAIVQAMQARSRNAHKVFLTSGRELAILLHERWEDFAGPKAKQRAAEKGGRYGVKVGSHFLLRAYTENAEALKLQAVRLMEDAAAIKQLRDMNRAWTV